MSARISTHSRSLAVLPPSPPPPFSPSSSWTVLLGPMPHAASVCPRRREMYRRPLSSRCSLGGMPVRASICPAIASTVSLGATSSVSVDGGARVCTKICIREEDLSRLLLCET